MKFSRYFLNFPVSDFDRTSRYIVRSDLWCYVRKTFPIFFFFGLNASFPRSEAIVFAFESWPKLTWTSWTTICCRSLEEIIELKFLCNKCPSSIQKNLKAFQNVLFLLYPRLFLVDRNFQVSTFQLYRS